MRRDLVDQEVDAGDVLVVGAGAAGLLTAVALVRRDVDVTVVDAAGAGAEQSGHHHGLLHAGSLYVGNSDRLVRALSQGRALWTEWLHGCAPASPATVVPIWDPFRVQQATRWWTERALSFEEQPAPAWLRGSPRSFATDEVAYDVTPAFHRMCAEPLRGRTARVRAVRLEVRNGSLTGVVGEAPDGRTLRMVAGRYVLAAGCGLMPLLRGSDLPRGRLTVRTSFMLVVEAEDLPALTVMLVEQELGGLFSGARHDGARLRWLVGDHLSLAGAVHDRRQEALWVHATVGKLRSLTHLVDGPGVRIGVYAAPKAELRDDPNDLSPFAVESYGLSNAVVVTPTKLTLAPALARRAADVVTRLEAAPRPQVERLVGTPLEVAAERWRAVPTHPVEEIGRCFPIAGGRSAA